MIHLSLVEAVKWSGILEGRLWQAWQTAVPLSFRKIEVLEVLVKNALRRYESSLTPAE
jgi:hypothetical protein